MIKTAFLAATIVVMLGALTDVTAQDVANGKKIFSEYCKTCHQDKGQGLGVVFPPLAKSDYIAKTNKEILIREVVFGKSGKVKINGKEYNGVMTPLPAKYTDKDIADVISFVFTNFGNTKGKVTEKEVKAAKKKGKVK